MYPPRFSLQFHLSCLFALFMFNGQAQELLAKEGSFGIDNTHRLIVWHNKNIDSIPLANQSKTSIRFNDTIAFENITSALSYKDPLEVTYRNTPYKIYLTKLPIVNIFVDKEIKDDPKIPANFGYFNGDKYLTSLMGIEFRGNLSLSFPKKSFDLEFWTDSISKNSRDLKFKGLKSDDDWILDGLYNEPIRLRSYMATKLWKKIHQPYYLNSEPKAESGFDVKYVEVFINQKYQGIYVLSESISRKLLQLREVEENKVRGELFKASSYEGAPEFIKAPQYNNVFPHWGGFEMEYPIVNYRSHWDTLAALVNLVVKAEEMDFAQKIEQEISIDNAIDYYLLVNLLRATDNLGKNYYLARYSDGEPYFFVPWDLDGVMGIIQAGKRIATTDDMLGNGLFNRLLEVNPAGFKDKTKQRWNTLRQSEFSDSQLFGKMEKIYDRFSTEKIYEREQMIWPSETTKPEHYDYLRAWLKDRLIFLDKHFEGL